MLGKKVLEALKGIRWKQEVAQGILPLISPHNKNVIKHVLIKVL